MKSKFHAAMAAMVGLLMIGGAAAGWKFWQIDGFLAFLLGAAGVTLVGAAFGKEMI